MNIDHKWDVLYLKWDSMFFKKKIGYTNLVYEIDKNQLKTQTESLFEYDMVVIKDLTNTLNNQNILLSQENISLVDLSVEFIKDLKNSNAYEKSFENLIVSKKPRNINKLVEIASKSFTKSRFYLDKNIDNSMASKLY
jgi:hypothetical protein